MGHPIRTSCFANQLTPVIPPKTHKKEPFSLDLSRGDSAILSNFYTSDMKRDAADKVSGVLKNAL